MFLLWFRCVCVPIYLCCSIDSPKSVAPPLCAIVFCVCVCGVCAEQKGDVVFGSGYAPRRYGIRVCIIGVADQKKQKQQQHSRAPFLIVAVFLEPFLEFFIEKKNSKKFAFFGRFCPLPVLCVCVLSGQVSNRENKMSNKTLIPFYVNANI